MGKILKWRDFSSQNTRKIKENSNLSALEYTYENGQVSNTPNAWKVYTRKYPRRLGRGKTITKDSRSIRKLEDAVMGVCEGGEGEMGIQGSSTSDDDSSSEEFVITSDSDVEEEKESQEVAAFEGVQYLLGEGRKELEEEKGKEEIQVPNQPNHKGDAVNHSYEKGGCFLSDLNIKLIKADKENHGDNEGVGPSVTKRSG